MLGREAAERATKSLEVDLSRLKGFHLRFAPKNEKWRDLQLVSQITFGSPWIEWRKDSVSLRSTKIIECLYVSPASIERANLFTLYLSGYEERFQAKIDQSLFESWIDRRKGHSGEGSLLTNILYRNCADKTDKTVVQKILASSKVELFPAPVGVETNISSRQLCFHCFLLVIFNNYSLKSRWIVAEYLPSREAAR